MSNFEDNYPAGDFDPQGAKMRRFIAGDAFVDDLLAGRSAFDHEWQVYTNNQLWARTWSRGILDLRQLSLMNLAMLAGAARFDEFEIHFRTALTRTQVPLIQLREALLHIALYCGVPTGRAIFAIARKVLQEQSVDVSVLDDKPGQRPGQGRP